jgi:pimeloyl-ACP methyl ester carboxylesterase
LKEDELVRLPGSLLIVVVALLVPVLSGASEKEEIDIRGQKLALYVSGNADGPPVVVSSGDGGWVHLAPAVARILASKGFRVVGFDAKAYLSAFTRRDAHLTEDDIRSDFGILARYAGRVSDPKPILVGVSLGAGLSVLAATDAENQRLVDGVIALGLPNQNELAWRFRDSLIYLTKKAPREPSFMVEAVIDQVSPLPLAIIHSTHDEFEPLSVAERLLSIAREPKRLWVVEARNHRFSGAEAEVEQTLIEAIGWVRSAHEDGSKPR